MRSATDEIPELGAGQSYSLLQKIEHRRPHAAATLPARIAWAGRSCSRVAHSWLWTLSTLLFLDLFYTGMKGDGAGAQVIDILQKGQKAVFRITQRWVPVQL